jgi:hypothetical protein
MESLVNFSKRNSIEGACSVKYMSNSIGLDGKSESERIRNMFFQGEKSRHSQTEMQLFHDYELYFEKSPLLTINKLQDFSKYVRRQDLARFLAKNELFKLQAHLPGSIVECGVFLGGGGMTYAQLSAIYEPYNHTRKVVCFDTFEGFPATSLKDANSLKTHNAGDLATFSGIEDEITAAIQLFDKNRPLSHIPKVELIKGDACQTIPAYLEKNPHLVVSMLYLDFDLYEPTKVALDNFLPRMPKGSILAFDQLNCQNFPGETLAVVDVISIPNLQLNRTPFDPWISYAIIE